MCRGELMKLSTLKQWTAEADATPLVLTRATIMAEIVGEMWQGGEGSIGASAALITDGKTVTGEQLQAKFAKLLVDGGGDFQSDTRSLRDPRLVLYFQNGNSSMTRTIRSEALDKLVAELQA